MKKKTMIIVGIILIIIILLIGGTYAYYKWNTSSEDETEIVTEVGVVRVLYDAGANMLGQSLKPVSDKELGIKKAITIKTNKSTTNKMTFNLYLDLITLDEGLKHESLKYAIYKGSTLVKEGNFSQEYLDSNLVTCSTNSTNHIVLLTNETITTTLSTYNLYIWIDGANYENPSTMQNQSFNFMLHADGQNALIEEAKYPDITKVKEGTLAYKIVNDYRNANKTGVANNGVRYYYDTENSLMADIGSNVRYYGADPNNYIYFNCEDYTNQTSDTCELWRIIGVFEDKVKIIRNDSLGDFSWDYDYNDGEGKTTYSNNWHTSSLQKLLNNQYYNNVDTVYYNNSTTGTAVNFKTDRTGIKNETTRNMIATVNYNLGGWNNSLIYSDQIYKYERGTEVYKGMPTSWTGKIALMYPSDYGYATDFTKCTLSLNNYDYRDKNFEYPCRDNDWLSYRRYHWLLTPFTKNSESAVYVTASGNIGYQSLFLLKEVQPVLYLNANTSIESANAGTYGDPYRLSV